MAIKAYFLDNIENFQIGTVSKSTTGGTTTYTYGNFKNYNDNSLVSISVEYDSKDVIKTYGDGKIIDIYAPHVESASGTVTTAKHRGAEFYRDVLGWEFTSANQVLGMGGVKCSPALVVQFFADSRPQSCDNPNETERVLYRFWNVRFMEPNIELEATNEDGPGENTQEIEFVASASTDPALKGHGVEYMFEDQDVTSPTYNGDIFDDEKIKPTTPLFASAAVSSITATGATITVTNPLREASDITKSLITVQAADGSLTGYEGTVTAASGQNPATATFSLTGLTASTNYKVFTNPGTQAAPIKGTALVNFATTATP